MNEVDIVFC